MFKDMFKFVKTQPSQTRLVDQVMSFSSTSSSFFSSIPKLTPYLTGPSSANIQPILVKFWILHLMTNPNKVYDTRPNLNHLKSQLISTTSNAYISDNSQPILFKLWILHPRTNPNKVYNTTPHQISTNPTTLNLKISTI